MSGATRSARAVTGAALVTVLATVVAPAAAAGPVLPRVERVSVAADGTEADSDSSMPSISDDGRYVSFQTNASTLTPHPESAARQVYVKDRETGEVVRASVATDGTSLEGALFESELSGDGRYAIFSAASRVLDGERGTSPVDIFYRDLRAGTTERVVPSKDGYGPTAAGFSASTDGRYIAYTADRLGYSPYRPSEHRRVYLYDRQTRETQLVSGELPEGRQAISPTISADGSRVSYIVSDSATGQKVDSFVFDRETGKRQQLNVTPDGTPTGNSFTSPLLSGDGRYAAFTSEAADLVPDRDGVPVDTDTLDDLYVRDLLTGTTRMIDTGARGDAGPGVWLQSFSKNGKRVVFSTRSGRNETWVQSLRTDRVRPVAVTSDGGTPSRGVWVKDTDATGRTFVFDYGNADLVPGDLNETSDVFLSTFR